MTAELLPEMGNVISLTTFLLGLVLAALVGAASAIVQAAKGYTGHNFRFTMTELIVRSVLSLLAVAAFATLSKLPLDVPWLQWVGLGLTFIAMIFAFSTYTRLTFRLFFHALKSI
ncbi:hypothetical protein [Mangrovicoccus ximenensis]|uniref:hypothetical protein n=1 Tax=Mangrovicoccus ximenensis TaxID=1911570 RepID=UPI000D358341|nr:hypothetical protein [Mangrovicoccus ximenensis]